MIKRLYAIIVAAVLALACGQRAAEIPFNVADHYFFRNDAAIPTDARIDDRETFDSLFGAAAVMGRNGMPTQIDFDRQFVIAVVRPVTDIVTGLEPVSLVLGPGGMTFTYHESLGERVSYSMQPILLVVVDRSDLPAGSADLPVSLVAQ